MTGLSERSLILSQVALGDPHVAPDGSCALYVRRTAHLKGYRSHVWLVPLTAGKARQLTSGAVEDSTPQCCDDNIYFLRTHQVHRVKRRGGASVQITRLPLGVSSFSISSDGTTLLLLGRATAARFAVGPLRPGEEPLARRITRLDWRLDGAGILDHFEHVFVQPARPRAAARQVTQGPFNVESAALSPDGTQVVFAADTHADADLTLRSAIHSVPTSGGEPRLVAELAGACAHPLFTPDGARVVFLGFDEQGEPFGCADALFVVDALGATPKKLGGEAYRQLGVTNATDLLDWRSTSHGIVGVDNTSAFAPVIVRGTCSLMRFPLSGQEPGECEVGHIHGFASASGGHIVTLRSVDNLTPELFHAGRRLTRNGAAWQRPLSGVSVSERYADGPAGPIRVNVIEPRGVSQPLPTILSIIGGPGGSWGPIPWLPDVALAERGYRVLTPDPRGSYSHGREWLEAIYGAWGGADADDQRAVCDWAVDQGLPIRSGSVSPDSRTVAT